MHLVNFINCRKKWRKCFGKRIHPAHKITIISAVIIIIKLWRKLFVTPVFKSDSKHNFTTMYELCFVPKCLMV